MQVVNKCLQHSWRVCRVRVQHRPPPALLRDVAQEQQTPGRQVGRPRAAD